jgi:hypothetical protein
MEAEAIPLPKLEITPPVINIYLLIFIKKALGADYSAPKRLCLINYNKSS